MPVVYQYRMLEGCTWSKYSRFAFGYAQKFKVWGPHAASMQCH